MIDPNPNQNNNDEVIDIYDENEKTMIYYDDDGEQHIEWKDE